MQTELLALQNAANYFEGYSIIEYNPNDKRKTVKKYLLASNERTISPPLDYENLNYFILGMIKASQVNPQPKTKN